MAVVLTGLLERDREIGELGAALARGEEGIPSIILLRGDAGIGKSSLLEVSAAAAAASGYTVLRARGGALERTLGWGVARQLFEGTVLRSGPDVRRSLLRGSAALAAPLLGLGEVVPAEPRPWKDFRLEHGLYWLTCNLAERAPLALLIDDAHWCDDATLEWLVYLARRSELLPLVVMIASRAGEPGANAAVLELLAAEPHSETFTLGPLGPEGTASLLASAYDDGVDESFASACHDFTGGNPLFVKELAAELAAEGVEPVPAAAGQLRTVTPESVSRTVLLRLARMSPAARELARAWSVIESSTVTGVTLELAGVEGPEGAAAVDELISGRVIDADGLSFVHPLIGTVIYNDIAPGRRAMMHRQAAQLLLAAGSEPGMVSAHLLRCSPAGEEWVVVELRRAARLELARRSPGTATALLRRAAAEPPPPPERADVLLELGEAELLSGDPAGAHTLRTALNALTDPRERARVALLLGRLVMWGTDFGQAVEVTRAAAGELGWEDTDLRLQLEALLIGAARADVELVRLIPERLALAREHARDDSYGSRLIAAQMAWGLTAICAPAGRCARWARRALAGGRLITENPNAPDTYLGALHMLAYADELEEANAFYRQAIGLAQVNGSAPAFSGASCFRAYACYLGGHLEEAELLARDALRTSTEARGLLLVQGLATAVLALALIDRGAVAQAQELVGDDLTGLSEANFTWATEMLFAIGRASVAGDRLSTGIEALRACGRRAVAWGAITPVWLPWRSDLALALHQAGEPDQARHLAEEELELARRTEAARPIGIALRAYGLIAGGALGLDLLRESCELLADSPAHLERARSLVALGQALRRGAARAGAREPLRQGLALAQRCGAAPLAATARTELAAAGARPRSVVRSGVEALTASERRVCELAAAGRSNPEIAQLLFVTRATVESHLHSAYRRLGIGSRKELAEVLDADSG